MTIPCDLCKERTGYPALEGLCPRCARDTHLFKLRDIADQAEAVWSDYADLIYRIEVHEGLRPPPSSPSSSSIDRPGPHGVQRESATGASSARETRRFSPLMKQGSGRSLTEDDLT